MRKVFGALALCLAFGVPSLPALAADSGTLLVMPAKGTLDTPIDVVTSGTCTRGVTFVVAVRGKGIDPVTSGNAVGNTDLTVLDPPMYPGHHAVPLSRTLRDYFTTNGVAVPSGDYDLVFACRNRLDMADLQTFSATISIDKSGRYAAQGASAASLEDFLARTAASAEPSADPQASPAAAQDQPAQGRSESSSPASAGTDPVAAGTGGQESAHAVGSTDPPLSGTAESPALAEAAATSTAPDNTWRYGLMALGAILLGGAGYMAWKARAR